MTPEKALELVGRYARLARQIKDCKRRIGEHLDLCHGLDGKRLEMDKYGCLVHQRDTDNKNRDKTTHLWHWYQPETVDDGFMNPTLVWVEVGVLEAEQCPHCYAAHLAIQERKAARKSFGSVKAAMARSAS